MATTTSSLQLRATEYRLELFKYAIEQHLSRYDLSGIGEFDVHLDAIAQSMVARLSAHVYGRKACGAPITRPATWWDAFKLRWLPAWALRRWPVRYCSITPTTTQLFQDIVPIPRHRSIVLHSYEDPKGFTYASNE